MTNKELAIGVGVVLACFALAACSSELVTPQGTAATVLPPVEACGLTQAESIAQRLGATQPSSAASGTRPDKQLCFTQYTNGSSDINSRIDLQVEVNRFETVDYDANGCTPTGSGGSTKETRFSMVGGRGLSQVLKSTITTYSSELCFNNYAVSIVVIGAKDWQSEEGETYLGQLALRIVGATQG